MPEYVRVRQDETGHELTVPAGYDLTGLTVIDEPALGRDGLPAPMKPKTPSPRSAARKKAPPPAEETGHQASTQKGS